MDEIAPFIDPAGLALTLLAAGLVLLLFSFFALGRSRPGRFVVRLCCGVALLCIGGLIAAALVGMQGYRALTREDVVGIINVTPVGPQRFDAKVRLADGRSLGFVIAGDELYVDARIIKWKPLANVLGLHTAYQLDRIGGRYRSIEQERNAVRTLYPFNDGGLVDLFDLRKRYAFLEPLYDAEYGSGTFVPVNKPAELELRVSTTGLLIRDVTDQNKRP